VVSRHPQRRQRSWSAVVDIALDLGEDAAIGEPGQQGRFVDDAPGVTDGHLGKQRADVVRIQADASVRLELADARRGDRPVSRQSVVDGTIRP
jgi:hypothetical protein